MESGQIAAIVAVIGLILAAFNITGVPADSLTKVVDGILAAVTIIAGIYSAYSHNAKNTAMTAAGLK